MVVFPGSSTYPDLVVWHDGDLGGVALHHGGETYLEVRPDDTALSPCGPRLLAPGNKVLVLVHIDHHVVHLLRRIPAHTVTAEETGSKELHLKNVYFKR